MQTSRHVVKCFTAACLSIACMATGLAAFAEDSQRAGQTADSTSNVKTGETKPATEPPLVATTFHIAEVTVERDKPWCDYVFGFACADGSKDRGVVCHPPKSPRVDGKTATPKSGAAPTNAATLVGSGDLSVCIPKEDFKDATSYIEKTGKSLHLYVNGVDMDADATLMATQDEMMGKEKEAVRLYYHISPGPHSQNLWATLYRTRGLTTPETLNVALGWGVTGPNSSMMKPDSGSATGPNSVNGPAAMGNNKVSVTDKPRTIFAAFMLVALFAGFWRAGAKTDILRGQPLAAWWKRASSLRNSLPPDDADRKVFLADRFTGVYDPDKEESAYKQAAEKVLADLSASGRYTIASAADEQAVIIGLILTSKQWKVPDDQKPSFSLAKVQLGMWFLFAVSAGIFLWVVRGQLAALDGSVLVLLGLSTATAGMSIAANSDERNFSRSNGFFNDLMTDSEGKYQVHRLQAVVVNVLLLVVGVFHVMGQLTFPVFETTWLAFLGISGVALAGGKQLLETKEPAKEPSAKT